MAVKLSDLKIGDRVKLRYPEAKTIYTAVSSRSDGVWCESYRNGHCTVLLIPFRDLIKV